MQYMESELGLLDTLDEFVAAIGVHQRHEAHLALIAHRLRERGDWGMDGTSSFTTWLRNQAHLSPARIAAVTKLGKFLSRFEAIADAATSGRLPEMHLSAIREMAVEHRRSTLDGEQTEVVDTVAPEAATPLDHEQLAMFCHDWKERVDAEHERPEPREPERSFTFAKLPDGSAFGTFNLDPALAAETDQALLTARHWNGPGDDRTARVRNADAFADIIKFFNANHGRTGSKRHHPHVTLHVNADDFEDMKGPHATTPSGQFIPQSDTEAFLCDCIIHRVVHTGSVRTDYGREIRTVTRHLFHIVAERDRGCRFPGCDRPQAWCDAHHVVHWTPPHNGETKLENLVLLCSRHHHFVHRQRWTIELHANGDVTFTTPDGRQIHTRPHAQAPPDARAA